MASLCCQDIGKDVEIGKKQLEVLEVKSSEVMKSTSPLGAEKIRQDLEELRRTLKELKLMNEEEEESLLKTYNSENAFLQLAEQLEGNIGDFRRAIQRLEESLECGVKVKSEEELVALWKTLNVSLLLTPPCRSQRRWYLPPFAFSCRSQSPLWQGKRRRRKGLKCS